MNKKYTIEKPLIVYNPYGTNNLSVNIYFDTEKEMEISYTVSVENEQIKDYKNTLNNDSEDNYVKKHSYQIIGLVPGYENTITLKAIDKEGNKIKSEFVVDMSNVKITSDIILESIEGYSSYELTEGLFVLFGLDLDPNDNAYIYDNTYMYDNNGVVRADLVNKDYRCDRIVFDDGKMYYNYDANTIGVVNRLGKIINIYELDGYSMHHDFVLDKANNKLLILVDSDKEKDLTVEDLIISLDLESGQIAEVVDMKDLLPEIYEIARTQQLENNSSSTTSLDWIHLNSLSLVNNNGDIVVSGRETSTIIYIENIYNTPKLKYMIAEPSFYKDTSYNDLVLQKIGKFTNQAGQHSVEYVSDDSLEEGQYYLEMYNNNSGFSSTRKDFPWDKYEGVGTYTEGKNSKYYKYLIDENKYTYELIKEFDVPYSSVVSSVQDIQNNHVVLSGMNRSYAEYDKDGIIIKQYNYPSKEFAYRAFKHDFDGIWFSK